MDNNTETTEAQELLNSYPKLSSIVRWALKEDYPLGRVKLINAFPAYISSNGGLQEGLQLVFNMPFAGKHIKLGLTCLSHLNKPPTVIMMEKAEINMNALEECLKVWDISDKDCLSQLLKILRNLYRDHEVSRFKQNKLLAACYDDLMGKLPVLKDYIEIAYIPAASFNVLVPIRIKTNDLPIIVNNNHTVRLEAYLCCLVHVDGTIKSYKLILSEDLEAILEDHLGKGLVISTAEPSTVANLIEAVSSEIERVLAVVRQEHINRRHLIAAFYDLYPSNVADYDSKWYKYLVLNFHIGDVRYGVHFAQNKRNLELTFFALNQIVKSDSVEEFPFCDKLSVRIERKPTDSTFRQYLHETFVMRLDDFMLKVMCAFTKPVTSKSTKAH